MRTGILPSAGLLLVLALSGCEGTTAFISASPVIGGVAVSATIGPPPVGVGYLNATTVHLVPACTVVIFAVRTIDVHHMTLNMIDGSNLGGPSITIPQAELARQFGTTIVSAGTKRSYQLQMPSSWKRPSYSMTADIAYLDGGVMSAVTAAGSWH